jgi:hypothetical protein
LNWQVSAFVENSISGENVKAKISPYKPISADIEIRIYSEIGISLHIPVSDASAHKKARPACAGPG